LKSSKLKKIKLGVEDSTVEVSCFQNEVPIMSHFLFSCSEENWRRQTVVSSFLGCLIGSWGSHRLKTHRNTFLVLLCLSLRRSMGPLHRETGMQFFSGCIPTQKDTGEVSSAHAILDRTDDQSHPPEEASATICQKHTWLFRLKQKKCVESAVRECLQFSLSPQPL
jgi:hypothetical protein